MRILVVDVAAEHSGAKTILEQFCREFDEDNDNDYIVALSTLHYQDTDNVSYLNFEWVKKSLLHRTWFDRVTMGKLIRKYQPDRVFSLQNNAVHSGNAPQDVYFQNALPLAEKKITFHESRYLWFYQTFIARIIRTSLKKASRIYVQTNWMKNRMADLWNIDGDSMIVKEPVIRQFPTDGRTRKDIDDECLLFYPANYSLYKNHGALIRALINVWTKQGTGCGLRMILTGEKRHYPEDLVKTIDNHGYPVEFVGRLNEEEMSEMYLKSTLIFPSYIETVGLPLIEAKQFGSWILCADLEYAHEAVEDYDKAIFFNPFSEESIANCISEYMNMKKEYSGESK